jgi:predicted RNA binding protein YcfA (HicA-like mRNA interferase family)
MSDYTKDVKRILLDNGYQLLRQGKGDHEIWGHRQTNRRVTVDNRIKSRHTANAVLKQAGLPKAF